MIYSADHNTLDKIFIIMKSFFSTTSLLFLGTLYVLTIGVKSVVDENCNQYWALKVDFTVAYTSRKMFPVSMGHQCATHCSANSRCVAIVTSKNLLAKSEFCKMLLYDENEAPALQLDVNSITTNLTAWVNSKTFETSTTETTTSTEPTTAARTTTKEATTAAAVTCPEGFTLATDGFCFLVDSDQTVVWDEAKVACEEMGVEVYLAHIDSQKVMFCLHKLSLSHMHRMHVCGQPNQPIIIQERQDLVPIFSEKGSCVRDDGISRCRHCLGGS